MVTYPNWTPMLIGVWLGVALRMDTKMTFQKENGLFAQRLLTILGSRVNIKGGPI